MVMRGEKCFWFCGMMMQKFRNRPGNGNAIVGAGASSYFIQQNQTSF